MTLLGPPPLVGAGVWADGPQALTTSAKPARIEDNDAFMGVRLLASTGGAYPSQASRCVPATAADATNPGRAPSPRSNRRRVWREPGARGDHHRRCAGWRWGCGRRVHGHRRPARPRSQLPVSTKVGHPRDQARAAHQAPVSDSSAQSIRVEMGPRPRDVAPKQLTRKPQPQLRRHEPTRQRDRRCYFVGGQRRLHTARRPCATPGPASTDASRRPRRESDPQSLGWWAMVWPHECHRTTRHTKKGPLSSC